MSYSFLSNISQADIAQWLTKKEEEYGQIFYSSVDIRDAGFKIAPVDTNIYPAGFNNISVESRAEASLLVKDFLAKELGEKLGSEEVTIVLVSEFFTRHFIYHKNVRALLDILKQAVGKNGRVLLAPMHRFSEEDALPQSDWNQFREAFKEDGIGVGVLTDDNGKIGILLNEKMEKVDLVISNCDFTQKPAEYFFHNRVIPNPKHGWFQRSKYNHLVEYNKLAEEFCRVFSVDKFFLTTEIRRVSGLDFKNSQGIDALKETVEEILISLSESYQKHNVTKKPYIFIKSDNGTQGLGIIHLDNLDQLVINQKVRREMDSGKYGTKNTSFVVQEGLESIEQVDGFTAETLIYSVLNRPISFLQRFNSNVDLKGNLNSRGMDIREVEKKDIDNYSEYQKVRMLIASLASLACTRENK